MSGGSAAVSGDTGPGAGASEALRDWQSVRDAADIQFAPVKPVVQVPPKPPAWLEAIGRFLKRILEPVGEAIGMSWPILSKVMLALAAIAALFVLWRLLSPLLGYRRKPKAAKEPEWAPDRAAALALLDDADKLAAAGRFDEAAHLLLMRSVGEIALARPDWLNPASTAREIAGIAGLPERARTAFARITALVERSLFALRPLDAADWQSARAAYADFALAGLQ
ncbi:MAG: DUF4129 domain-containing protein [Novosphingobium sp.]